MSEWQPIETAPKDGTHVVMFATQRKNSRVNVHGPLIVTGYWDVIDEAWCSTGSTFSGPFYSPTHWMPLPAPPTTYPDAP